MNSLNRACCTCGKRYRYCPSCQEDTGKPTWMVMFHDANCKKIFNTLTEHFCGRITNEEAADILKECDLSLDFERNIQKDIDDLIVNR